MMVAFWDYEIAPEKLKKTSKTSDRTSFCFLKWNKNSLTSRETGNDSFVVTFFFCVFFLILQILLGGGFNYLLFSTLLGAMVEFDYYFSDGLKPSIRIGC